METKGSRYAARMGCAALGLWMLWAAPLWADVKVERVYSGPLPGVVGSIDLSETVYYADGDKMRREPSTEVRTSKIKLWGSAKKAEITRLDKELFWYVDYAEDAYTEQSLADVKQQSQQQLKELEQGGGEGPAKESEDEKPTKRIVRNEVTVKRTGEKQEINGFNTEQYVITWLIETEDVETKEREVTVYTADEWNADANDAKLKALRAEQERFDRNLQRKLGMELSAQRAVQLGQAAVASALADTDADTRAEMEKIAKELEKVEGYPIRTLITIKTDSAEAREESGGQDDSGSGGGLMDKAASKVFSFIGEKKDEPKADAGGMVEVFRSTFELKAVETKGLEADLFAPPKGFKRVKEL